MQVAKELTKQNNMNATNLSIEDTTLAVNNLDYQPSLQNPDPIKIDAMFFPSSEEKVVLLGDEYKSLKDDFCGIQGQKGKSEPKAAFSTVQR